MQGILFDLDGVIYQADQAIPGAGEALDWVKSNNIPYLFVTNTTSKPQAGLQAALVKTGKFQAQDLQGPVTPNLVMDSIADLPAKWQTL
jgi:ribonucleotide monophosphatase NagD (HAD superfamily)